MQWKSYEKRRCGRMLLGCT